MSRTNNYRKFKWSIVPVFLIFISSLSTALSAQKTTRVPMVRKLEKGVFSPRRTFGTYISDTKAFKFDSTKYSIYSIWKFSFDEIQHYYNKFLDHNRNDSDFIKTQKRYGWDTSLVKPGFDNSFFVFAAIRKDGQYVIIPDQNQNKNFSDDVVNTYRLSKVPNDSLKILTERLPIVKLPLKLAYKGKFINRTIAVQFYPKSYFGNFKVGYSPKVADSLIFTASIHQFLEGKIVNNENKATIVIRNANTDIRYNNIESVEALILSESGRLQENMDKSLTYNIGDTFAVGNDLYKFVSIDHLGAFIDIAYVGKNKNIGIVPGRFAKYFSFTNIVDKKPLSLKDYKGKYLLIDFWGTWCGPCKEILPDIKKMATDYKDRDFKVLSIANDYNLSIVKKFIQSEGMDWDHHFEPFERAGGESIIRDYKIQSYPTTILIDPSGKILYRASNIYDFKTIQTFVEGLFK